MNEQIKIIQEMADKAKQHPITFSVNSDILLDEKTKAELQEMEKFLNEKFNEEITHYLDPLAYAMMSANIWK